MQSKACSELETVHVHLHAYIHWTFNSSDQMLQQRIAFVNGMQSVA